MLSRAIEAIDAGIDSLKDRTAGTIKDIYDYLSQPGAKSKIPPRIMPHKGYSTFSIIWQKLVFYDFANRRAIMKAIRKGPSHQVPRSRLLVHCRNCASWETEYIWENEKEFARVRRKVALLSQAVSALKQYCALERAEVPEEPEESEYGVVCMDPQEIIKTLISTLKRLKEIARQEVAEVTSRLAEDGLIGLRPEVKFNKASDVFSVEWVRKFGTGLEREIARGGTYSIRRSRLLAHCRDWGEREQQFVWDKELEFIRVRRQADLLGQTITALRQYTKEIG